MRRTSTVLGDGRELIYFDDVDRGRVPRRDTRTLGPRPPQSEIRIDALTGLAVVVSAHRQTRTFLPVAADCPLCPGVEIPDPAYDVAVFENRWPALSGVSAAPRAAVAAGRCEVIAFADGHNLRFADLPPARVKTVIQAWADRTAALHAYPDVAYVACFENRGESIGVTLHHPHGQIYAYPFVPPVIAQIASKAAADPALFAKVVVKESAGPRIVAENDHWIAYVPEAASWPYELIVMPRIHLASLSELDDSDIDSLAHLLPDMLGSFDRLFDIPVPYIAGWRQSPKGTAAVRLHLRVMSAQRAPGKLKFLAGSESAYGVFINDVLPEDAAAALRGQHA